MKEVKEIKLELLDENGNTIIGSVISIDQLENLSKFNIDGITLLLNRMMDEVKNKKEKES